MDGPSPDVREDVSGSGVYGLVQVHAISPPVDAVTRQGGSDGLSRTAYLQVMSLAGCRFPTVAVDFAFTPTHVPCWQILRIWT